MEHRNISAATKICNDNTLHQVDLIRGRLESALRLVDQFSGGRRPAAVPQCQTITVAAVRALLKYRRNRDYFFSEGLFADPAWDILLELYAAELGQQRLSVTSLCAGAAVPGTTALRWITQLERKGYINRCPDPLDGRRFFVSLSSDGLRAMEDYFRTVPIGVPVI
jgi:DNA-binding MarR family transcriptional regulator